MNNEIYNSMLQFYLAKIIKRSEFDYADFYYQRYLLNLIASMPSFGEKVRLSSLIKTWLQSNINDIASMPTTDDRYIRRRAGSTLWSVDD